MTKPSENRAVEVDRKLRLLFLLWAAFLSSAVLCGLIIWLAEREETTAAGDPLLATVFAFAGLAAIASSVIVKRVFLALATARHKLWQVVRAYLIAFVLCDAAAMLGLIAFFLSRSRLAYVMCAVAALAIAAHRPRRDHLEAVPSE